MALIPWWIRYPNVNDEIMNLDWLLKVSNENSEKISNFINLNTIKYADPILWDITSQYEANTITVDPQTGDAYISTKAVPYGVALSNTDFWTKIYNYANEMDELREQIAAANEELSTTATAPRAVGDLVWLNGLLYEVTAPMIAGDSYVVDSNCKKVTIEQLLKRYNSLIDDEVTARENADTQLQEAIDNEVTVRENADIQLQDAIDNIPKNEGNVKQYNASGSNREYTGTSQGNVITLGEHDFKVGEGVLIANAGNNTQLSPVTGLTATYHGAAGNISHRYGLSKMDNRGGYTACTFVDVANCSALGGENKVSIYFNQDPDAYAYLVYRDGVLVDIISTNIMNGFEDWQLQSIAAPFNVPSTPSGIGGRQYIKAHVTEVSETTITLDVSTEVNVTSKVIHDDTDAIQNCINENNRVYIPEGHYNISITSGIYCLSIPSNCELFGDGYESTLYSQFSICHGAMLFNSCNVVGGTNNDINIHDIGIDTNYQGEICVSGISFRLGAVYMAANNPNKPKRISVHNCIIRGVSGGITFASIVDGKISNNIISDCIADGCGCYDTCETCVIENNNIINTGDDSIGISNASNNNNNKIVCINNKCTRTGAHGIRVEGTFNVISNNIIEYTAMDGIYIHKYVRAVTGNIICDSNHMTRIGDYTGGVGGNTNGTYYDVKVEDTAGSDPYGWLNNVVISNNNFGDNNALKIEGNSSNRINSVNVSGNIQNVNASYHNTNNIDNLSFAAQKQSGTVTITPDSVNAMKSVTVSFNKMPYIPSVFIVPVNGLENNNTEYFINNITDHEFTLFMSAANIANYNFNWTVL